MLMLNSASQLPEEVIVCPVEVGPQVHLDSSDMSPSCHRFQSPNRDAYLPPSEDGGFLSTVLFLTLLSLAC